MLIVNVINTLPNRKDEELMSMSTSGEVSIEKNGRREIIFINKRAKRARYVVRRPYFLPYVPIQLADRTTGLTKENF